MTVRLHPHARERLATRGATEGEVILAVQTGERFVGKYGRTGFRRNYPYNELWRGRMFATKQIEAFAVAEANDWLVITVIVKFF